MPTRRVVSLLILAHHFAHVKNFFSFLEKFFRIVPKPLLLAVLAYNTIKNRRLSRQNFTFFPCFLHPLSLVPQLEENPKI